METCGLPEAVTNWNALTQISAIALALLAVSFVQALCSAVQADVSTDELLARQGYYARVIAGQSALAV
jgi:hypothetical protein